MQQGGMSSFEQVARMGGGGGGDPTDNNVTSYFLFMRNFSTASPAQIFGLEKAVQQGLFNAASLEEGFLAMVFKIGQGLGKNPIAMLIKSFFEDKTEGRGEGRLGLSMEEFEQARAAADMMAGASGDAGDFGSSGGSGSNKAFSSLPDFGEGVTGGQDISAAALSTLSPSPVGKGASQSMGMGAGAA